MKDTSKPQSSETRTPTDRDGVAGVVHLALDVADRGHTTAIAVLQDARVELRTAVDSGIELAEKLAQGALRFSRKLVAKLDEAGNDALTGAERALSNAVKSAREARGAAGALASGRSHAA